MMCLTIQIVKMGCTPPDIFLSPAVIARGNVYRITEMPTTIVAAQERPLALQPGQKRSVEERWRKFFSDPSQWWDHRSGKTSEKYPDFKHKKTQQALWLNDESIPQWVEAELAALSPGMLQLPPFSYNKQLARYLHNGHNQKILDRFQQMRGQGLVLNRYTFISVLKACANLRALEEGRQVHVEIIRTTCESDLFLGTSLVDMYAKCGSIEDAQTMFEKMPERDVVSWNAMIRGYVKCGQGKKALDLYARMQVEQVEPVAATYVGVVNACASVGALEEGKCVHARIIQSGCESDLFVSNSLVDMYTKCGSIEDAQKLFNKMHKRDVVSWNSMILGHVKCEQGKKALELYRLMQSERVEPDPITFTGVLNACASIGAVDEGRHVHAQIIQSGLESNIFVGNCLVDMYSKCGSIDDAWTVFNTLPKQNVVTWNSMISGHLKCGQAQKAIKLYRKMEQDHVEPDKYTFVGVLNVCASLGALEEGRRIHNQIILSDCASDLFVANSLIDMYVKCGSVLDARRVFDKMPERDVVSWNSMILGHVKWGQGEKALNLYQQMQEECVEPNGFTFVGVLSACAALGSLADGRCIHAQTIRCGYETDLYVGGSLVDMYAKCGRVDNAQKIFNKLVGKDVVTWNAMILGYVKCGQGHKALELYRQMQMAQVVPDSMTFVAALTACTSVAALVEGRHVHAQIIKSGCAAELFMDNSLIDMYAKCGSIESSQEIFNKMSHRDNVSWNVMIGGYAIHGYANEAISLFEEMRKEGVKIDSVTFTSLLSACSHAGLVDEGLHYFMSMTSVHGIAATVEHYSCMVDLLGRSGQLQEAEYMIKTMSCEPDVTVWMTLLGACRVHGNVEMGERIAEKVIEMDPRNAAGYVVLSNIYAAAGKWDSRDKVQCMRSERGVQKVIGCSWIELNNKVHTFVVDDQAHPQIPEIHAELKRLSQQMKEAGYVPDTRFVLHDVDEEEKMSRLGHHSEKLAIALGLLRTSSGSPLHIIKNLRVCGDCHTATKFISKVTGRPIVVRDTNRFHHFKDGVCSCRDYW